MNLPTRSHAASLYLTEIAKRPKKCLQRFNPTQRSFESHLAVAHLICGTSPSRHNYSILVYHFRNTGSGQRVVIIIRYRPCISPRRGSAEFDHKRCRVIWGSPRLADLGVSTYGPRNCFYPVSLDLFRYSLHAYTSRRISAASNVVSPLESIRYFRRQGFLTSRHFDYRGKRL